MGNSILLNCSLCLVLEFLDFSQNKILYPLSSIMIFKFVLYLINDNKKLPLSQKEIKKNLHLFRNLKYECLNTTKVYDLIKNIMDPEYPYTLEQLNIVSEDQVTVDNTINNIIVHITPTVQHCSMATLIGLCVRYKLGKSLKPRVKIDVMITPGSHSSEASINKQLNDKERVSSALENPSLLASILDCQRLLE